jgi:hypothetical protein
MIDTGLTEKTAAGHVYRRDLYDELVRRLNEEAGRWNMLRVDFDETWVRAMPTTVAAGIVEKWLTEVYQPALIEALDNR